MVPRWAEQLAPTLAAGRDQGMVGSADDRSLVAHSARFVGVAGAPPHQVIDLGSGVGLPGLVLALAWPTTTVVLVESQARRADRLAREVTRLGLDGQAIVINRRAEDIGRDHRHRGQYDLVSARSFGPPAATAECAAGLARVGGVVLVSEPPGSRGERWPAEGLGRLGLALDRVELGIAVLRMTEACDGRWPRRPGIPAKRPLFG